MKIAINSKTFATLTSKIAKKVANSMPHPKQIEQTADCFISNANKIGKHKIPRYIYHLTTQENYEKMKNIGFIIPKTSKGDSIEGVFATELTNLLRNWSSLKIGEQSLINKLLSMQKQRSDNLVMLKIPTNKLNAEDLYIRSQNNFFLATISIFEVEGKNEQHFIELAKKLGLLDDYTGKLNLESILKHLEDKKIPREEIAKIYKTALNNTHNSYLQKEHFASSDVIPAVFSSLYEQKGHAIEYIYKKPIPIDLVEPSNIAPLEGIAYDKNNNSAIIEFFKKIFQGKPEEKAVKNILMDRLMHYLDILVLNKMHGLLAKVL